VTHSPHRAENIALIALAVIVLSIAGYALITNKPEREGQNELESRMPAGYEATLAALIRASGKECDRVCSAELATDVAGVRSVRAACSVNQKQIDCAHPLTFDIAISGPLEPTR
jgi:hypothetical protein